MIALGSTGSLTSLVIQGQSYDYRYYSLSGPTGAELSGGGFVTLSDNPNNQIVGASPTTCSSGFCGNVGPFAQLINDDNTIQGAGTIGSRQLGQQLTLINHGTIVANASNPLTIVADGRNDGFIEAAAGSTLVLQGSFDNTGGTFQALDGGTFTMQQGGSVNNGIVQALGGGTLDLQGGTIANAQLKAMPGGVVDLGGVTISGSTLSAAVGGVFQTMGFGGARLDSSTISDGLTVNVVDGSQATLVNAIVNHGVIALGSTGSLTSLVIQGQSYDYRYYSLSGPTGAELSGGGFVTLSDNPNNQIVGASPTTCSSGFCGNVGPFAQLINDDNTIQGAGTIGSRQLGQQLTLINHGTIVANASNPLTIVADGRNDGFIEAAAGSTLVLQGSFDNTGGTFQALDGGTFTMQQGGSVNNGIVQALGGGTLDLQGGTIANAQLKAMPGGVVDLGGVTISGSTLSAAVGGVFQTMGFGGARLDSSTISDGLTVNVVDGSQATLVNAIVNHGVIALGSTGSLTSLVIQGQSYDYRYYSLSGPTGAELSGGGFVTLSDNPNNQIVGASPTTCSSGFCGNVGPFAQLINDDNTIQGAGTIGSRQLGQQLTLINHGTIVANASNPLTIVADGRNDGFIEAAAGSTLVLQGSFDNTGGTFQALDGGTFTMQQGGSVNNGIVQALGGGTLDLQGGTIANAQLKAMPGGVVDLGGVTISGSTLSAAVGGVFQTMGFGGARLDSSTISDGLTVNVVDGSQATLVNAIVNHGVIALGSTGSLTSLVIQGQSYDYRYYSLSGPTGAELSGGGFVTLSDNPNNQIVGASPTTCSSGFCGNVGPFAQLINDDNTIQGAGTIGSRQLGQQLTLINHGTIVANASNPLTIVADGRNDGFIEAAAGSTLVLQGSFDNTGGTFQALDGGTFTMTGRLANYVGTTLTGGTYNVVAGGNAATVMNLNGTGIATNAASVTLSGAGAIFTDLSLLRSNEDALSLADGQRFQTMGDLQNVGDVQVLGTDSALAVSGTYTQAGGSTILHGGTLAATDGITVSGGTIGGTGVLQGDVTMTGGNLQVGASPDTLVVTGNYQQSGGSIGFEIYSDGHGGFLTDTLLFQSGALIDISHANILFTFETSADPLAFFRDGRFNFNTFVALLDGSGSDLFSSRYNLRSVFQDDTYAAYSADYHITGFRFDPGLGALNLGISGPSTVPEPASWLMMVAGFGLVGAATRRRSRCEHLSR